MTQAESIPAGCLTPPGKPLQNELVAVVDLGEVVTMHKYQWNMVKNWLKRYLGVKIVEHQPDGRGVKRQYSTRPGPKSRKEAQDD